MIIHNYYATCFCALMALGGIPVAAQDIYTFAGLDDHKHHDGGPDTSPVHPGQASQHDPSLPDGMTLDDVLDFASEPTPADYPDVVDDNAIYSFILLEQIEYRVPEDGADRIGWEGQGWVGYDFDKLWVKSEGEYEFEGADGGEAETDLLYARLISPFWYVQFGVQYANTWGAGGESDTWSGVIALQGLAPGAFEVDTSLYISEKADVTLAVELEYNVRITQRLILQPRLELELAAQDIPERGVGQGLTTTNLDLRLQYEIERRFTPYIGVRYSFLSGETADMATAMGNDREQLFFLAGLRLAY